MSGRDSPVHTRHKGSKGNPNSQFEEFVTKAFNNLKRELKDVQAFQADIVKKLQSIEESYNHKLQEVDVKVTNIAKTCDFVAEKLSAMTLKVNALEEESAKLQTQTNGIETAVRDLNDEVNKLERFSRRNNLRIIGFEEEQNESPLEKVEKFLEEKFQRTSVQVERAHRVGRRQESGKHRQIIVKMLRYTDKVAIMKEAKLRLKDTSFRIVDDLTKKDLDTKVALRPIMKDAYSRGKRVRYMDGRLYIDNVLYKG